MTFRAKIFYIIFLVGLVPAISVLIIAAFLLNTTLTRVGAAGLESSIEAARSMVESNEAQIGKLLSAALQDDIPWINSDLLNNWLEFHELDLVFRISKDTTFYSILDSAHIDKFPPDSIPSATGFFHWKTDEKSFFLYSIEKSGAIEGCGILIPIDYSENGMLVAEAVSASASLSIYRNFSLKLLTVVTFVSILVVLAAGLLLSRYISKQLVKPLNDLTEGAKKLGGGDLTHRVVLSGDDEFARLAGSFNRMASEIDENQRKLIETERLAAWREVARRIAHEIKNPLTPMAIEIYRLKEMLAKDSNENAAKALEAVDSQINVLRELAGQFSTFAKEPELKKISCSIADIITQTVELYKNYDNVTINTEIADNLPLLQIDTQMMGRVFGNIIKNCIEAFADNAIIDITVNSENDIVKIIIKDNGPGFPMEKLENIDQPYFTTKKSGSGLGLAIIKKIVEEHGGKLSLYNDNGAVVEIALPVEI